MIPAFLLAAVLTADPNLNRLQAYFAPTLDATRRAINGQTGKVLGFSAGSGYPQIWIRDAATHLPLTRFHAPVGYLTSWIEEHLAAQADDGNVFDWICTGPFRRLKAGAPQARIIYRSSDGRQVVTADKNTMEADQESSLVEAAYQIWRILGDLDWLRKPVAGSPILTRLDRALSYVRAHRFDPGTGLVTSGYTTDFGDVSPLYPDQRAIYLDSRTPVVACIYPNAFFYRAAQDLGAMHLATGNKARAKYWRQEAERLRASINRHLWDQTRGYYHLHVVVTPDLARGFTDNSAAWALGGNSLALLYGLADQGQGRQMIAAAERLRQQFGVSTIAGNLLPPWPTGFFKHPYLREEFSYLNGGQWDWFAGRFIQAEFERGYSRTASRQLSEIAARNVAAGGLFEWYTRDGRPKGSANYLGSAAALAGALYQGKYGVYLSHDELQLQPRLGEESGSIALDQPSDGTHVTYQYSYDPRLRTVSMTYESNFPHPGAIRMLLPAKTRAVKLTLDGKRRPIRTGTTGEDTFLTLRTDWKRHTLAVEVR